MARPANTNAPPLTVGLGPPGLPEALDLFFAELGLGVNPGLERRAALAEIARLSALSDADLARAGLRRDGIAAHVLAARYGGKPPA